MAEAVAAKGSGAGAPPSAATAANRPARDRATGGDSVDPGDREAARKELQGGQLALVAAKRWG